MDVLAICVLTNSLPSLILTTFFSLTTTCNISGELTNRVRGVNRSVGSVDGGYECRRLRPFTSGIRRRLSRGRHLLGVGGHFATGISRRLGAPLASVSNCNRVLRDGVIHPRSIPRVNKVVCGRSRHLVGLARSVVRLSRLRRCSCGPVVSCISLVPIIGCYISILGFGTRGGGIRVAIRNASYGIGNAGSLVRRLICGLIRGTVGCGISNNGMAISISRRSDQIYLGISSANVNVPRGCLNEIFRHFFEISGSHSGTANNAKLNLTVIGRATRCLNNNISIGDGRGRNARVAIVLTG